MKANYLRVCLGLLLVGGCQKDAATGAAAPPDTPMSSGDSIDAGPTEPAGGGDADVVALQPGEACPDGYQLVSKPGDEAAWTLADGRLSRELSWGCGCPRGPELVLVYEPGTAPLRLRLCHDDSQDPCEALCTRELTWDVSVTGATAVEFVL